MLYLPPRLSHWGIAETEGMTFSVGFRSPSLAELLADLAIELSAGNNDIYYRDPQLSVDMADERIHPAFIQQVQALLGQLLSDDSLMEDWFARVMTTPKYPGLEKLTKELRKARIDGRLYHNGDIVN
jgi:50S ribosomal protein L16 3-hydroxylase